MEVNSDFGKAKWDDHFIGIGERLPNKHWFDVTQFLFSINERTKVFTFLCDGLTRHGRPILRVSPVFVCPPQLLADGNWYISFSYMPIRRWLTDSTTRASSFPWGYQARHGLYPSIRQALKALHEYERILIENNFDERAADDIFLKLRGGSEFAPQDGVKRTDEQVVDKTPNGTDTDEFTDKKE